MPDNLATVFPPYIGLTNEPSGLLAPQPWPTVADVNEARRYKERYGNINQQDIPTGLLAQVVQPWQADRYNRQQLAGNQQWPTDKLDRDSAYTLSAAQLAAQRSPLGYLGFDVNRMAVTPADPYGVPPPGAAAGTYTKGTDRVWTDLNFPTNAVHESIHRGIAELRRQGMDIPPEMEEQIVRAQMLKYYGDVETTNAKQKQQGRDVLVDPERKKMMDEIERRATEEGARRLIAKQGGVF